MTKPTGTPSSRRQTNTQRAIRALEIDAPIYRTVARDDGTVEITTRDGMFTWRPRPANSGARKRAKRPAPRHGQEDTPRHRRGDTDRHG